MSFNMDSYISNLSYINKDFNSLWEEMMETIPKLTSKWSPREANESDPLVVLLKELGIISDKLNYNIDKNILEAFPDTLTQLRAAYSVFASMGYTPRWYKSAVTKVKVTYNGGVGESVPSESTPFILPKFTAIRDSDSRVTYTLLEDMFAETGAVKQVELHAIEGTLNDFEVSGNTLITTDYLDSKNRLYFVQPHVAQNGIFISEDKSFQAFNLDTLSDSADSGYWHRVTNLYQQLPGSKVFQFGIDSSTGSTYIQFPEDVGSLIGNGLYIKYILSSGSAGNIAAKTLTDFVSLSTESIGDASDSLPTNANFTVSNAAAVTNGSDPETIAEMQKAYQKVVGTFDTLVTLSDYEKYLYNQADALGQPIVSNIRVSDRTNDLYSSLRVQTLDAQGQAHSKIVSTGDDSLTAYDLRFYPVGVSTNSISKSNFNSTFKTYEDMASSNSKEMQETLVNEVEEARAIIHNYKDRLGSPIYLNYGLKGQIFLQQTVSSDEASSIRESVIQNLCTHLNARELEFGQAVDYRSVVEWIKDSDPRIQYVALEPISYEVDKDSLSKFAERTADDLDIYKRSVLKGATPWTDYSDLVSYWNTAPLQTNLFDYSKVNGGKLASISPQIFDNEGKNAPWSGGSYKVRANETLAIIVPEYVATTTYSNYFYAVYKDSTGTSEGSRVIAADTPYQLDAGQAIYIYEERPSGDDISSPENDKNYRAKLGPGSTIKSNVPLGGSKYPADSAINMGSSITISEIKRDESKIASTYAEATDQYKAGIKITTNSPALIEAMSSSENGGSYTLNIGESLLWTNNVNPVVEVGTINEGNTIVWTKSAPVPKLMGSDWEDFSDLDWVSCNNGALSYRANSIYNFGEGYTITLDWPAGTLSTYKPTAVNMLPSGTVIKYSLDAEESGSLLPSLLSDECYGITALLSVSLGPGTLQRLERGQKVELSYIRANGSTETTTLEASGEGPATYLNSNTIIVCSGGLPTPVPEAALSSGTLQTITANGSSEPRSLTSFVDIGGGYTVPGQGTTADSAVDYFVIPVICGTGSGESESLEAKVRYLLAKGQTMLGPETNLGSSDEELYLKMVGQPYKIMDEAQYYTGLSTDSGKAFVSSILGEEKSVTLLSSSSLYHEDYNPLYVPKEPELIEDPYNAMSYFNAAHVCNRYVLPKLTSWDNLTISSLSIRRS